MAAKLENMRGQRCVIRAQRIERDLIFTPIISITLVATLALCHSAFGAIIRVPQDSPSISNAFALSTHGDTILVSNGLYQETVNVPQGLRTLASRFIFSGDEQDVTTTVMMPLDTVFADTATVLYLAEQCSLHVIGLTFAYGKGIRRSNGRREGGAIYATLSSLHVTNCAFENCFADFGVCIWTGSGTDVAIRKSCFLGNGRVDGVTFSQGCIRSNDGEIFVDSCRFSHNTVTGAAAIVASECIFTVENCVVDSNFNMSASLSAVTSDNSELYIRNCLFADNVHGNIFTGSCVGGDGQSAVVEDCSFLRNTGTSTLLLTQDSVAVRDCTFEGNIAVERNPACVHLGYGHNVVERCVFVSNAAPRWATLTSNNTAWIRECFFSENTASDDSGAVMSSGLDSLILEECAFENNSPYAFSTDFWWYDGYVDARNCYWGAPSGPFHAQLNPDGDGDAILGSDVLFVPWLTEPPLSSEERIAPAVNEFGVAKAYPNPFNSTVTIEYALTREQKVKLDIYDVLGRNVETLFNDRQSAGVHSILWQADSFTSGVYFAKLSSLHSNSQTVKLLLLK